MTLKKQKMDEIQICLTYVLQYNFFKFLNFFKLKKPCHIWPPDRSLPTPDEGVHGLTPLDQHLL